VPLQTAADELLRLATETESEAVQAQDRGELETALTLMRRALDLRKIAARVVNETTLHDPSRDEYGGVVLTNEHKLAISEGVHRHTHKRDQDPFMAHIRSKGYTIKRLAGEVGLSVSGLSQARRHRSDPLHRPIRKQTADLIEHLTGWPATRWPRVRD
jgi:hypothetical protein